MLETDVKIGVYSETDRLKTVAVFGLPGVEALVAQLYPEELSLFQGEMDVLKARTEVCRFSDTLNQHGVTVYTVKDSLVKSMPQKNHNRNDVFKSLLKKAERIQRRYGRTVPNFAETLETLIDAEIEIYGNDLALGFIDGTCLKPNLPLANLMYARDPMNVILNTRFVARLARPIRQPETVLYEKFYTDILGLPGQFISPNESFEGGDAYIHANTVFIGTGPRTTINAALGIFRHISPYQPRYDFAIVNDKNWRERSIQAQQDYMHLDTFSMPAGTQEIVVCEKEGQRRQVNIVKACQDSVKIIPTNKNYIQYLKSLGQKVLVIPAEEQQSFGCNFLVLDENTILVPRRDNTYTNNLLEQAGKKLINVDLSECTKGYGAAHCMTAQLLRSN